MIRSNNTFRLATCLSIYSNPLYVIGRRVLGATESTSMARWLTRTITGFAGESPSPASARVITYRVIQQTASEELATPELAKAGEAASSTVLSCAMGDVDIHYAAYQKLSSRFYHLAGKGEGFR